MSYRLSSNSRSTHAEIEIKKLENVYIVHFESTLGPDVGLSEYYLHNDGKECW